MSDKPTCGVLYLESLRDFCGDDLEKQQRFAAGFVTGQAEKVYLGACEAAMFRPSADTRDWVLTIVEAVATRYGLHVFLLTCTDGVELWIHRSSYGESLLTQLRTVVNENSRLWHDLRGILCGVPAAERDLSFHLRRGYGEKCDGSKGGA